MKRIALVFVILFTVSCCGGLRPPPVPIEPDDTHNCAAACENLRKLGCPEGDPVDAVTCEKDCVDIQESGHALNPTCVMKITACDQINACMVNRRGTN
jgi:hypothetical protein